MTGTYTLYLSSGEQFTTVAPLEAMGAGNQSTPRKVLRTRPTFTVVDIPILDAPGSPSGSVIEINNDVTEFFPVGITFNIPGEGIVTVANETVPGFSPATTGAFYNGSSTYIILEEVIAAAVTAELNIVSILGDATYRFVPGFQFDIELATGSPSNNGTYTVSAYDSFTITNSSGIVETVIPVDETLSPSFVPLGQIVYAVLDNVGSPTIERNPSILLPGQGTVRYGDILLQNMLRMTENFAADLPPNLNTDIGTGPSATPLVGQQWFSTAVDDEGFRYWNGSIWTSSLDINDGALIFRDPGNGDNDIYLTAAEGGLPGTGSPIVEQSGLVVWPEAGAGSPEGYIFRVLTNDGTERLGIRESGNTFITSGSLLTFTGSDVTSLATNNSTLQAISTLTLASGADTNIQSTAGTVDVDAVTNVELNTSVGDIIANAAGAVDIDSGTGNITIDSAAGIISVNAVASSVDIDGNQGVTIDAANNNISIAAVTGNVDIQTPTGDITLGTGTGSPQTGGNVIMETPPQLPSATVSELTGSPMLYPATRPGQLILVTDEIGGSAVAFSDGVVWRRVTDRAIVS